MTKPAKTMAFSKEQHEYHIAVTDQYFSRGKMYGAQDERKRILEILEKVCTELEKDIEKAETLGF